MRKKLLPPAGVKTHEEFLTVTQNEIDNLNHVNNVVYLQWVNTIAENHWEILSNDEVNSKYYWVCTRHEIDYLGEALLHDNIRLLTWIGETGGVKSIRYVNIYNEDKLIVTVSSTWCLIDKNTSRPSRIDQEILDLL